MEVRFEIIDASEEEQMLTLIQKTLLKVMINLELPEEYQFNIFHYFMKVLKVKSIEDADQIYSVQFADQTKKNLHKVLYHLMYAELSVKSRVFKHLFSKIKKSMSILEKKPANASKLREFICFVVKTIEDCFRKIPSSNALSSLLTEHRADLVQVVC